MTKTGNVRGMTTLIGRRNAPLNNEKWKGEAALMFLRNLAANRIMSLARSGNDRAVYGCDNQRRNALRHQGMYDMITEECVTKYRYPAAGARTIALCLISRREQTTGEFLPCDL